jgi:hypothetical protein
MLLGRSIDRMHVSPVFNLLAASARTGLIRALDGPFASLARRRLLSIPSLIKPEDDWI